MKFGFNDLVVSRKKFESICMQYFFPLYVFGNFKLPYQAKLMPDFQEKK